MLATLSLGAARAATGGEPPAAAQIDVAACLGAAAADDIDKAVTACAAVIDNEKTAKVGMKNKRLTAAWNDHYLEKVLCGP